MHAASNGNTKTIGTNSLEFHNTSFNLILLLFELFFLYCCNGERERERERVREWKGILIPLYVPVTSLIFTAPKLHDFPLLFDLELAEKFLMST